MTGRGDWDIGMTGRWEKGNAAEVTKMTAVSTYYQLFKISLPKKHFIASFCKTKKALHNLKIRLSLLVEYYGLNSHRYEQMNKINFSGSSQISLCNIGQNISFQKKNAAVLKQLLSSVCINTVQKLYWPSPSEALHHELLSNTTFSHDLHAGVTTCLRIWDWSVFPPETVRVLRSVLTKSEHFSSVLEDLKLLFAKRLKMGIQH